MKTMVGQRVDTTELKTWIEPEIRTLEISETHLSPNVGADGGAYPVARGPD
jgi:hypothetical protein